MMDIEDLQAMVLLSKWMAFYAHEGVYRRDGITPYIEHPRAVADRVKSYKAKAVAWLHDTIEDAPERMSVTIMKDEGLPKDVIDAVVVLTHKQSESYSAYVKRVAKDVLAKEVKIADIMANITDTPSKRQIQKYTKALDYLLHRIDFEWE